MSAGFFDYKQFHIGDIIDEMEDILKNYDKKDDFGESLSNYVKNEEKFKNTINEAINYLKLAKIYTNRIDYFLSGDDSEKSFYKRLNEDLKKK